MDKPKEVDLEEQIFGDSVKVIFTLKEEIKTQLKYGWLQWSVRALSFSTEFTDIIFYKDIINYIEREFDGEIESATIIAENGLKGYVLKYNHIEGLILYGETRGYA